MDRTTARAPWLRRSGAALFLFFAVKGLAWLAIGGLGGKLLLSAW